MLPTKSCSVHYMHTALQKVSTYAMDKNGRPQIMRGSGIEFCTKMNEIDHEQVPILKINFKYIGVHTVQKNKQIA